MKSLDRYRAKALPDPLAAIRRPTSKGRGREWRGREGEGREGERRERRGDRGKRAGWTVEGGEGGERGKEGMKGREREGVTCLRHAPASDG